MTISITQQVSFSLDLPAAAFTFTPAANPIVVGASNAGTVLGSLAIVPLDPAYNFSAASWSCGDARFVVVGTGPSATLKIGAADIVVGGLLNFTPSVTVTF